ncbi:RHS repeat-associated core domain-containing protein [Paraburkholderia azotifigens]|nr:RHS repeat-associated core domain-containing protein [Paraburkholderia azotifigens]
MIFLHGLKGVYNLNRHYDRDSGRFISQDPIGLSGLFNLYQYAPNPVS